MLRGRGRCDREESSKMRRMMMTRKENRVTDETQNAQERR